MSQVNPEFTELQLPQPLYNYCNVYFRDQPAHDDDDNDDDIAITYVLY
jgi:hypothetical protein